MYRTHSSRRILLNSYLIFSPIVTKSSQNYSTCPEFNAIRLQVNSDVSNFVPVYLRCHRMSQINASRWWGPELTSAHLKVNASQLPQHVSIWLQLILNAFQLPQHASYQLELVSTCFNSSQMSLSCFNMSQSVSNHAQSVPTFLSRVDRNRCHSVPTSKSKVHLCLKGFISSCLAIVLVNEHCNTYPTRCLGFLTKT